MKIVQANISTVAMKILSAKKLFRSSSSMAGKYDLNNAIELLSDGI